MLVETHTTSETARATKSAQPDQGATRAAASGEGVLVVEQGRVLGRGRCGGSDCRWRSAQKARHSKGKRA
eukprot:7539003-Alexandrium_andersonii.AAC.1